MKQEQLIEIKDNDSLLKQAFAEMRKGFKENNKEFANSMKALGKNYDENSKAVNQYVNALKDTKQWSSNLENFLFGNPQKSKNALIVQDTETTNSGNKSSNSQNTGGLLGGATDEMGDSFSKGLQGMIKGYKSFSDVMKGIGADLTTYMVKQMTDMLTKMLFTRNNMESIFGTLGAGLNWGGGAFGSIGKGILKLFKHHSGGVIPSGANYSLPGTQEQLALLKGGERVLSPSENVSYESSKGGQPVVFNNFNIKAWDSKDVSKYLLENKQLLNAITFEGIRNNNGHLRTMVRNA